jgi:hypothetical protein
MNAAYRERVEIKRGNLKSCFGAGIDTNIEKASIKALVSALNRSWLK